jgi:hypothetical protein
MASVNLSAEQLHGSWRLVSATTVDPAGRPPPYGPIPMGNLVLNAAGRMMGVICDGRTEMPPGEPRGYTSYCGNFEVSGDELTTNVDAASNPDRVGGQQVRKLVFRGDLLVLTPPRRPDGDLCEFVYAREGPA